jgi:hypothetical protein
MKHKMTIIFMMQGHRFPVMGIAWNHGENFLASSDFYGIVIVWKREREQIRTRIHSNRSLKPNS